MTRDIALNEYIIPSLKNTWNDKKCEEVLKVLEQEHCREQDDYKNEIEDLHNRLDIAEYDKERFREEVTRLEEKIKALEREPCEDFNWRFYYDHGYAQAKRDLEQEPCEDAISRQAVIDAIKSLSNANPSYWNTCDVVDREYLLDEVEALPSVTPQPKTDVFDKIKTEIKHFMFEINPSSSESDYACNHILDLIDKHTKGGE